MRTRKILIYLAAASLAVLIGLNIGCFTHRSNASSSSPSGALLLHLSKASPELGG